MAVHLNIRGNIHYKNEFLGVWEFFLSPCWLKELHYKRSFKHGQEIAAEWNLHGTAPRCELEILMMRKIDDRDCTASFERRNTSSDGDLMNYCRHDRVYFKLLFTTCFLRAKQHRRNYATRLALTFVNKAHNKTNLHRNDAPVRLDCRRLVNKTRSGRTI